MSDAPTARPGPGSVLANRYRVLEPIGHGGMGRVFRAHDTVLDRDVAVKLLEDETEESASALADEARLAASLSHPGIAGIFDVGRIEGSRFIVMELVPGRSLHEVIRERGSLPVAEATAIAVQVASALEAAHHHGIVHCDVKPQNVVLTPGGQAKLVDFGISRVTSSTHPLDGGEVRGSIPYVAPEQVRGESIDGRADVYALGAVVYEMLAGRPPFTGATPAAVVSQRLVADPPSPQAVNPKVPPAVATVVLRALARDRTARFASAAEFGSALGAAVGTPDDAVTAPLPLPTRLGPARGPGRAVMAAAALAGLGLVAVIFTGSRAHDEPAVDAAVIAAAAPTSPVAISPDPTATPVPTAAPAPTATVLTVRATIAPTRVAPSPQPAVREQPSQKTDKKEDRGRGRDKHDDTD